MEGKDARMLDDRHEQVEPVGQLIRQVMRQPVFLVLVMPIAFQFPAVDRFEGVDERRPFVVRQDVLDDGIPVDIEVVLLFVGDHGESFPAAHRTPCWSMRRNGSHRKVSGPWPSAL